MRSMNATIQVVLDSNTPPQITHNNHLTWRHGKTKVILQTTWAGTEGTPWRTSFLRVSTKVSTCVPRRHKSQSNTCRCQIHVLQTACCHLLILTVSVRRTMKCRWPCAGVRCRHTQSSALPNHPSLHGSAEICSILYISAALGYVLTGSISRYNQNPRMQSDSTRR